MSGAQGLALPAGSAFHRKAPQTSAGMSLGKQALAGRQREQHTPGKGTLGVQIRGCSFVGAPSLTVSSGSLFTAALQALRNSLASRDPTDSAQGPHASTQPLEG